MLKGEVTSRRQAIVTLRLRGKDIVETEADVILDTGFTEELALGHTLIEALGWPRLESSEIMLADATIKQVNVYEGRVWWNQEWRSVLVQATEGMPVLGMGLLYNNLVTLEAIDGGEVTVEPLE